MLTELPDDQSIDTYIDNPHLALFVTEAGVRFAHMVNTARVMYLQSDRSRREFVISTHLNATSPHLIYELPQSQEHV